MYTCTYCSTGTLQRQDRSHPATKHGNETMTTQTTDTAGAASRAPYPTTAELFRDRLTRAGFDVTDAADYALIRLHRAMMATQVEHTLSPSDALLMVLDAYGEGGDV